MLSILHQREVAAATVIVIVLVRVRVKMENQRESEIRHELEAGFIQGLEDFFYSIKVNSSPPNNRYFPHHKKCLQWVCLSLGHGVFLAPVPLVKLSPYILHPL